MRMLMTAAALSAGILALSAGGAEAADFTNASLQGSYSLSLNGTITFVGGKSLFLPTWVVGVAQADGAGNIVAAEAVGNVGGDLIPFMRHKFAMGSHDFLSGYGCLSCSDRKLNSGSKMNSGSKNT